MSNICFIGAGNMAQSIIGGLINAGTPKAKIWATARSEATLSTLRALEINVTSDNLAAIAACDIVVLAVKPAMFSSLCEHIAPSIGDKLVISVAAGITCDALARWLGKHVAIVRSMPNTPSLIGEGVSGLFANTHVSPTQKQAAHTIAQATGRAHWIEDEALMHTVIAVSGSGPAYFFLFLESMIDAAIAQGMDPSVARDLAIQTAKGAALLAEHSDDDVKTLRQKVTSAGGTTEQAILSFEATGLRAHVATAMNACAERSKTMEKELN
ncbi:pyrroline-5-carboxylate reductase [Marinagarivorans algicola]|uniref:pyrroline-5-carboxylate reductase n=1 Tax=Marinagarivorans algicola TaxID=1513270 RepID=UPI000A784AD6|nr:pyrroline-5-carboxylate reductase [Marinagarivorans algicola]